MGNPYPANFETLEGSQRLTGQVDFTDAGNQPGGGPTAGSYVPTAFPAGATVDTTTYDDQVSGVGKLTTLVFPTVDAALAFAVAGDAFPRIVVGNSGGIGICLGNGTADPVIGAGSIEFARTGNSTAVLTGTLGIFTARATGDAVAWEQVSPVPIITSGALPTITLVSGAAQQVSTTRDVETVTPFTGDATNNAATCKIELSPDNVTYTTLNTMSIAAATNLSGALDLSVNVRVPAGWYIKLTATHGTLADTTYY